MLFLSSVLLAISALPATFATIDNSMQYKEFMAAATPIAGGDYIITNVGTGDSIHYVQNNRQFYPASGSGSPIRLADAPGGNYTRISADTKCLSAQWNPDEEGPGVGADAAGVLYSCVFGANTNSGSSVRPEKQKWLFVPTDYDQESADRDDKYASQDGYSDLPTYYNDACCEKSQGFIQRHPQYVKSDNFYHMECASELTQQQRRDANFTNDDYAYLSKYKAKCQASLPDGHPAKISKRAPNSGTFYIITLDHLSDQATRVLGPGVYTENGADARSINLDVFSKGNSNQQWRITKA